MRTLIALLMLASTANAEWRYTGTAPGTATLWLSDNDPTWPSFSQHRAVTATMLGEWTFDIVTDGQSFHPNVFEWNFTTTTPLDHHIGQIDFFLDATIEMATRADGNGHDLNPYPRDYLRVSQADWRGATVGGHYRSLNFTSEFDELRGAPIDGDSVVTYFDFANYESDLTLWHNPEKIEFDRTYRSSFWDRLTTDEADDYLVEPGLYIRAIDFEIPNGITLSRFTADATAPVTGNDFLEWQRDPTPFGLVDWERDFLGQHGGTGDGSVGGVPEPKTAWLAMGMLATWALWCCVRLGGRNR